MVLSSFRHASNDNVGDTSGINLDCLAVIVDSRVEKLITK